MLTLDAVPIGQSVRMVAFHPGSQGFRHKLLAMGLTPGVCLTVLRIAPLGDPVQVRLRGCLLSLRKKECQLIEVEYVERQCPQSNTAKTGDCACWESELREDHVI